MKKLVSLEKKKKKKGQDLESVSFHHIEHDTSKSKLKICKNLVLKKVCFKVLVIVVEASRLRAGTATVPAHEFRGILCPCFARAAQDSGSTRPHSPALS